MQDKLSRRTFGGVVMASAFPASGVLAQVGPQQDYTVLASWRDGDAKRAVLDFLRATTTQGLPDYVPPGRRTAVFDNDGTLWTEQPVMPEVSFALARLRALAPQHPEWTGEEPFRSALQGDLKAVAQGGVPALVKLVVATQAHTHPNNRLRLAAYVT